MTMTRVAPIVLLLVPAGVVGAPDRDDLRGRVLEQERRRIEVVERVAPACVCISSDGGAGGGSGVLIDEDGYGLTNFHVVAPMTGTRVGYGGLSDGQQYRLEVLGFDITGDVAMFRLIGKDRFPYAELGDSAAVRIGDAVIAMGNPFSLAQDYSPTVTTGIVTGVHRYQGESDTLVYTDCIQTDASINPGNSGGPLFDENGRVIGINGRISAEMHKYARGRYNVGLGYAISVNQIKRFMPHLRAGLLGKHGTLLATVTDDGDQVVFDDMYEDAPAWDAAIRVGDRLLRFGDQDIRSANHFASLLGTYPEHWPVPVTFESRRGVMHKLIRLESVTPPMNRPYAIPAGVNREAVRRTLDAFRQAVAAPSGDGGSAPSPRAWSWTAIRTYTDGRRQTYRVEDRPPKKTARSQLDDAGDVVRTIVSDGQTATVRDGAERYEADTEEMMLYTALHALRRDLLANAAAWQASGASHAGGDALVEMNDDGHITQTRLLETIVWALSEHVSMRVGFELDTHLPARLVVRDAPSDVTVEVTFDDPHGSDQVRWPHRMRVAGPTLRFEEVVSDLRVAW